MISINNDAGDDIVAIEDYVSKSRVLEDMNQQRFISLKRKSLYHKI